MQQYDSHFDHSIEPQLVDVDNIEDVENFDVAVRE